ncbi:MAG: PEP-CTERM sorting domain-containing protein [Chloroflexi bacterium]|nr:PEP-CTERM sorting domain-containing protein [Chloroflexota bacterium]
MKRAKIVALSLILLFFVLSTVASASNSWPGWFKKNRTHGTVTTGGTTVTGNGTVSVAEPLTILLLGTGLVSLGIYAKRKRGKKQ